MQSKNYSHASNINCLINSRCIISNKILISNRKNFQKTKSKIHSKLFGIPTRKKFASMNRITLKFLVLLLQRKKPLPNCIAKLKNANKRNVQELLEN
jgi:hypothetical protein